MTAMDLSRMAVVMVAWRRPYYLRETLGAWSRVRGIGDVRTLAIARADYSAFFQHIHQSRRSSVA